MLHLTNLRGWLGVTRHVSQVQRLIGAHMVKLVEVLAAHVNKITEAAMPPNAKPFPPSPIEEKKQFIEAKYKNGR